MSERLRRFVRRMDIRPSDRVLEIGCGHGIATSYVCDRLEDGRIVAIDRSKKMIEAAARRNAPAIEAGKAAFLVGAFETVDLDRRRFDKIFAVRVGLFHREPRRVGGSPRDGWRRADNCSSTMTSRRRDHEPRHHGQDGDTARVDRARGHRAALHALFHGSHGPQPRGA